MVASECIIYKQVNNKISSGVELSCNSRAPHVNFGRGQNSLYGFIRNSGEGFPWVHGLNLI